MRMSVIGCGYLGAVHAAAMASIGHDVIGIDTDPEKIAALAAGRAPFFEPGLDELLASGVASGRLTFSVDIADAHGAQVHFVAVGTPQQPDGSAADLRYVHGALDALHPQLRPGDVVAGKSTVPVGTAAGLAERVADAGAVLVWNPEFLREGWAVHDTLHPDRLVVGAAAGEAGERAVEVLREAYADAISGGSPFLVTDLATAELVKGAANAFLATKISFINAMAEIAEASGADVTRLAEAIGHDERIGRRFLGAGIGFGGGACPRTSGRSRRGRRSWAAEPRSASCARSTRSTCVAVSTRCASSSTRSAAASSDAASPCSALRSSRTATTCGTRRRSRSRSACGEWARRCG